MENSEIVIRGACLGDEKSVQSIVCKVLQEFGLQPEPGGIDADLEDLQKHYGCDGCRFLVVEDRGKVVGCGGLGKDRFGQPELRKMYLLKQYRGQGLGKNLLLALLEEAKNQGAKVVTLETASVLKDAICLYESFGFARIQSDHLPKRCDLAMKLDLENLSAISGTPLEMPINPGVQ